MSKMPDLKGYVLPAIIPAAPGTKIIELTDVGAIRTPVVFWAPDAENPYRAPHPITVSGLKKGGAHAIEFDDGMIHDPRASVAFADVDEWMIFAEKAPSKPETNEPEEEPGKTEAGSAEGLQIEWTSKPYKTNSFYRYTTDDLDFLFQVEGGCNPPKQTGPVTKVKRDEFMKLKKEVDVADYDALLEGRAPGVDDIGDYGGSEPAAEEVDDDDLI